MKRILTLFLMIGLLYCLPGCGLKNPEVVSTKPETIETAAPDTYPEAPDSTEPPTDYQLPLIAVSAPPMEEVFTDANGTVLLCYTYQDLRLTLKDPVTADAISLDFLNLLDPMGAACEEILQSAKLESQNATNWSPYRFSKFFTPMRLDNGILSMYGVQILSDSTGKASSTGISLTYDLLTGQRLTLAQILREGIAIDALDQAVIDSLSSAATEGILYDDYAQTISSLFSSNSLVENWYLSENGLCFFFDPYEIAPYSAGTVIAEIPYSALTRVLKEAYFPEETVVLTGFITMEAFAGMEADRHTQFAELILDPHGMEYLIHVSGAVDNLILETGTWQHNGTFTPEVTVFSSAALCSEDALLVQISEAMVGSIRITYRSGNIVYSVPLSSIMAFG